MDYTESMEFSRPARSYPKSFKLGFNSMWTKSFHTYKPGFKEAEEPEIKLPEFTGSWRKQGIQKNIYFSFIDDTKACNCVDHNKLWSVLKETRVSDQATCLLRNLYSGKEVIELNMEQWIGSKFGKGVSQGCVFSSCLFNFYAQYIILIARLEELEAGIKIARRNTNNLVYTDDTTLMAESEEELKSLLMKVKEESERAGLNLNIEKSKKMASGPITAWQIDGGKWKQW